MFAYLYIPKNAKPPYQTIIYFPGGWALFTQSSDNSLAMGSYDFLIRTGRAVLFPVYKGTFERRVKLQPQFAQHIKVRPSASSRDHFIDLNRLQAIRGFTNNIQSALNRS